jgi:hypothetical protein
MVLHPGLGPAPLRWLALAVAAGEAPRWAAELLLAGVACLGAGDTLRVTVARSLEPVEALRAERQRALGLGGGDRGNYQEHFQVLCRETQDPETRTGRAWFAFALARRWAGLDALREPPEDPVDAWLAATAAFLVGESDERLVAHAQGLLDPVASGLPRLVTVVARELTEVVARPRLLQWAHLRCAAERDHASAAIRAWLRAASEAEPEEPLEASRTLGPEPTRAARAAAEAQVQAGEFLLDWYVSDREARSTVDRWAAKVLRVYHRLRGARLLARVLSTPGVRP